MTENKGSGESDGGGAIWRRNNAGRSTAVEREKALRKGRVTFTVRADQFPVPSIIDVTSTVGCYLSGLTDRNTIPTGSPHTHTHTRLHTHTHMRMHVHTQPEKNV